MLRSDKGKRCDENGAVVTIVQPKGEWNEMDDTKNDCFALVTLCLLMACCLSLSFSSNIDSCVLNPLSKRFFSFLGKGVVQQKREADGHVRLDYYLCAMCVRRKVDRDVTSCRLGFKVILNHMIWGLHTTLRYNIKNF